MYLQNDWRIIETLKESNNLQVIQILCKTELFYKRYKGPNFFFRDLKNGLYSIGGITNRSFFNGISGVYISYENPDNINLLIIYDTTKGVLNELQLITRVKKLLGISVSVVIGNIQDFEDLIVEVLGIKRKVQPFGDFYFRKKSLSIK